MTAAIFDESDRVIAPPQSRAPNAPDGPVDAEPEGGMIVSLAHELRIYAAMELEPQLQIVCCWCTPHHVLQVGAQPTSHSICPLGVAKFETGGRS